MLDVIFLNFSDGVKNISWTHFRLDHFHETTDFDGIILFEDDNSYERFEINLDER